MACRSYGMYGRDDKWVGCSQQSCWCQQTQRLYTAGIFIRTPLSEQNTTLSRTPPKFSRTPLWAEHHFEQNTTQNSNFRKAKCKIYPINTLIWFTLVLLWFVNRTIYCTKRNESINSASWNPAKKTFMAVKRIVVSQSYHCISQSVIVTSNHTYIRVQPVRYRMHCRSISQSLQSVTSWLVSRSVSQPATTVSIQWVASISQSSLSV